MKKIYFLIVALSLTAITSCRQKADDLESQMFIQTSSTSLINSRPKTYTEQFDALWNGMNQNYVAWKLEDFNWDDVYATKRAIPMAWDARLKANPNDTVSDKEFKEFYSGIINPFHDHHMEVFIWNLGTASKTRFILYPGNNRLQQRDNYNSLSAISSFRSQCVKDNQKSLWAYTLESLDNAGRLEPINAAPYLSFVDMNGGFMSELAVIKTQSGKFVPYVHWNIFNFSSYIKAEQKNNTTGNPGTASGFLNTFASLVKTYGEQGKLGGVILDVRNNAGGDTGDYAYLLGRLLEPGTRMILGNTVRKNGVGRLDYSPSAPFGFIIPNLGQYPVTREPIIVLCDGLSISMSEITTYSAKLLPNGHVIGDRTFGGFNSLDQKYDATYAGSFGDASNGPLYVYTPYCLTTPVDGSQIESIGVIPDEYIPYNEHIVHALTHDLGNITDAHIEAAIKYVK